MFLPKKRSDSCYYGRDYLFYDYRLRGDVLNLWNSKLQSKLKEAVVAVVPILLIVLILSFSITPLTPSVLLSFLVGALLVIFGMMFFTLGAEISMTPMGEKVGAKMTQSKNVFLIVSLSFLLGIMITISEPDLQVLAELVPSIPNIVIILAVAVGVGIFLVFALLRILYSISLAKMLVFFYLLVFIIAAFVPADFRAVAFDSGGVASGPMTATFLLPLAQGACTAVGGNLIADAFGVVAMVAMTPLITIQIMGAIQMKKQKETIPSLSGLAEFEDDEIIDL